MPAPVCEGPPPLVLASGSPRRRELLRSVDLRFEVIPSRADEPQPGAEAPRDYARNTAALKAREVHRRLRARGDRRPVLAADTVVVLEQRVLGKPDDRPRARAMLRQLSGRQHQVITACCIIDATNEEHRFEVVTEVRFKQLAFDELEAYLDHSEWTDKAGAYGIQGRAAHLVRDIQGSYTNVVGLPLCETVDALRQSGLTMPWETNE